MKEKLLREIADSYGTDKGSLKHYYTDIYSNYLESIKDEKLRLLEIGVAEGSSILMWSQYMKNSYIIGADYFTQEELIEKYKKNSFNEERIDVKENMKKLNKNKKCELIQLNQSSRDSLNTVVGEFDVIIDDGSHVSGDILLTLSILSKKLKKGGYYFIEDLNCSRTIDNRGESNIYLKEHFECRSALQVLLDYVNKELFNSEILTKEENYYINGNLEILSLTRYNKEAGIIACLRKI